MKMLEIRYQICSGIGEDFSAMLCKNTHTSIIPLTESYSFCATSCNNNLLKKRIGTLRNIHYSNGKKFESFCIEMWKCVQDLFMFTRSVNVLFLTIRAILENMKICCFEMMEYYDNSEGTFANDNINFSHMFW